MHSGSEGVILAADGLSALDKERTDHSSISEKKVKYLPFLPFATFVILFLAALGPTSLQTGVIWAD